MSPCDYGTQDCLEPATAAVSIGRRQARPMCRRHILVWVETLLAVYGDSMTLQIRRLDLDDPGDG